MASSKDSYQVSLLLKPDQWQQLKWGMFSLISKLATLFCSGQMEFRKTAKWEGQPETHTLMSSFASNASLIAVTTFAVTPHFPTCKSSDTFLVGSWQLENLKFHRFRDLTTPKIPNPRPTSGDAMDPLRQAHFPAWLLKLRRSWASTRVGPQETCGHNQVRCPSTTTEEEEEEEDLFFLWDWKSNFLTWCTQMSSPNWWAHGYVPPYFPTYLLSTYQPYTLSFDNYVNRSWWSFKEPNITCWKRVGYLPPYFPTYLLPTYQPSTPSYLLIFLPTNLHT